MSLETSIEKIRENSGNAQYIYGFPIGPAPLSSPNDNALVLNPSTGRWDYMTFPSTFAAQSDVAIVFNRVDLLRFPNILLANPAVVTPEETGSNFALKAGTYRIILQLGSCSMTPSSIANLAAAVNGQLVLFGEEFFPQGTTGTLSGGAVLMRVLSVTNDGDVLTFALTPLTPAATVTVSKAYLSIEKLA